MRQVTQLNQGKKTAGIDGKITLNYKGWLRSTRNHEAKRPRLASFRSP
ncbi:reverse transcriptase N-terminal domain-containing protein [Moorena sp. SIO4G3]